AHHPGVDAADGRGVGLAARSSDPAANHQTRNEEINNLCFHFPIKLHFSEAGAARKAILDQAPNLETRRAQNRRASLLKGSCSWLIQSEPNQSSFFAVAIHSQRHRAKLQCPFRRGGGGQFAAFLLEFAPL